MSAATARPAATGAPISQRRGAGRRGDRRGDRRRDAGAAGVAVIWAARSAMVPGRASRAASASVTGEIRLTGFT